MCSLDSLAKRLVCKNILKLTIDHLCYHLLLSANPQRVLFMSIHCGEFNII